MVKSRRIRGVGQVACMGGMPTGFQWENQTESDHYRDISVDVRIMLKQILRVIKFG
jgi:hypothetical protein